MKGLEVFIKATRYHFILLGRKKKKSLFTDIQAGHGNDLSKGVVLGKQERKTT